VHQFTDKGLEFWSYTGDPTFPFQPVRGATLRVGLAARWSVAEGDQCLYFLGRKSSSKGQVAVYELSGHQARSITTPDIANLINAYGTKSDAVGYTVSIDEHTFYVLSFPTAGKTWVYDAYASGLLGVPVWSELSSANGRHYSDLGFTLVDVPYVSDYATGSLYRVDPTVYTDNGVADRVGIGHAPLLQELRSRDGRCAGDADFETGVGNAVAPGDDPQVMVQVSRDGGRTWGAEQMIPLGKVGEYTKRVELRRLGTARDFVFKLRITDPVKRVLTGLGIRATPGVN
jgi:hypothetical protein